jgi:S-adenosylmethionine:tRNA ribosyltransferase-isomerase
MEQKFPVQEEASKLIFTTEDPRKLSIEDFTYDLPEEKIARFPLPNRADAKLLIPQPTPFSQANAEEVFLSSQYHQLPAHLPSTSLLVFNNTKVVQARLYFYKPTGGRIEIFCLEPSDRYADVQTAMLQKGSVYWRCMVGGAAKWKEGNITCTTADGLLLQAEKLDMGSGYYTIRFSWNDPQLSFAALLEKVGELPLPPYLNRKAEESDIQRYQTVYAEVEGSVAAPTAGLHFTQELLLDLTNKGIQKKFVTLHVGAGTFKPVSSSVMEAHDMHAEYLEISNSTLYDFIQHFSEGPIVAVGTTSLRTLESLYWMGVKIRTLGEGISISDLEVKQWDPYDLKEAAADISTREALSILYNWMQGKKTSHLVIRTQIMIAPGYHLRVADAIITNFHQPQSTLILLIAAVVGPIWRNMYAYALENEFRFLSYGDGCLLWNRFSPRRFSESGVPL